MFPLAHKTVFVLDRSPAFAAPCERIDIEAVKAGQAGMIPLAPVDKSVWTSATESVLEYCRVVWDIFPPTSDDKNEQRLVRFVVCHEDDNEFVVNAWETGQQGVAFVANGLAHAGRPNPPTSRQSKFGGNKFDIRRGVRKALRLLSETTPTQRRFAPNNPAGPLVNRGRIVCLTSADDETAAIDNIVDALQSDLVQVNAAAATSEKLASVAQVDLDLFFCRGLRGPSGRGVLKQTLTKHVSPKVSCTVSPVTAGVDLSKKLLWMALRHFDLASTTVTGIPMKEEQNASSSANYDVELFHKASAHTRLMCSDVYFGEETPASLQSKGLPQTVKEGCGYTTITLKWCTPRGSSADLHNCTALARVTPTDVNSRPSSCLTNFLLSGRSVMLEMPARRSGGSKILSHMLTSHGGEIFIHTLNISRSVLEDPPSISEGPGGRVTDYRISDLGDLMKANRLAPHYGQPPDKAGGGAGPAQPLDKAAARLARFTTFFPATRGATTIFNMEAVEPLQRIMVQEELTDENLAECRKVIYSLLSMENKGEALPAPLNTAPAGGGGKAKGMKKDDQYKVMFGELERFVASHCCTEKHHRVLDCLLDSRNRTAERPPTATPRLPAPSAEKASELPEADNKGRKRPQQPSTAEAAPAEKRPCRRNNNNGLSLFDMYTRGQKENSGRAPQLPFVGMRTLGDKARLYLSLERKDKEAGQHVGEM